MATVTELRPQLGVAPTCAALGVARASWYRAQQPRRPAAPKPVPRRALVSGERARVLGVLHEPRFADLAPAEIYATLLDEGCYLCSERTLYRVLAASQQVRERRRQLRHPHYAAPELLATGPNQLWSWDITRLLGPSKWTYFYLYVLLDVFSRYVVGWMLAHRESAQLAERLIAQTCERQGIERGQLTLHSDRGSSMTSKPVALLLADLGVTKTHSRPHVSNDNPFSESLFRTMKYVPEYPRDGFVTVEAARVWVAAFVAWYNHEHKHSGIGFVAPADRHAGRDVEILSARRDVYERARRRNPARWSRHTRLWSRPDTVTLNPEPDHAAANTDRLAA